MSSRKFLCPESIQTSDMDCGPAALVGLLSGLGISVSYGRLREACQTDVDGTSIDTLEDIAIALGVDAEQVLVPIDHVLVPEANCLPAIILVVLPNGFPHFIVVWRVVGKWVQIMDPGAGRRWVGRDAFLEKLYRHEVVVPGDAFAEWASSDEFVSVLHARMKAIGVAPSRAELDALVAESDHASVALLDGAVRMVTSLVEAEAITGGRQAARLVDALVDHGEVPDEYCSLGASEPDDGDEVDVRIRGAVLVRALGVDDDPEIERSSALQAVLDEEPRRPLRELFGFLRQDGLLRPASLVFLTVLVGTGLLVESILFRSLVDVAGELSLGEQRFAALGAVAFFALVMLALELPRELGLRRIARGLETRMRIAFLSVMPRLADRYFRSRPVSDMASRAHHSHRARQLPELGGKLIRSLVELLLLLVALCIVAPRTGLLAVALSPLVVLVPLLGERPLAERDLRLETHAGGLLRFHLDSLLGLVAIRTHRAERAVRREHEHLLTEWARAGFSFHRLGAVIQALTAAAGLIAAVVVVLFHARDQGPGSLLLVAYWALALPVIAEELARIARLYPTARSMTLRLLEPMGAPDIEEAVTGGSEPPGPVSIELREASVVVSSHTILDEVSLAIEPGEHVAIVGSSGAGKSTLVSLLLGFAEATPGSVLVDGEPLTRTRIPGLRRKTAWIDPEVRIWQRTLLENLDYGNRASAEAVSSILAEAELSRVVERADDGLQSMLGEGGRLLSGGEAQRVRVGRGLLRENAGLVILDEAFRGLDRGQRERILQRVRDKFAASTLLCVTHDISHAEHFPRVLVVEDGGLVEDGSPAELRDRGGRFAALLAADHETRNQVWGDAAWRKIRVRDGEVESAT